MRTTLVPSMLGALATNANRGVAECGLFEIAPTFQPRGEGELPEERPWVVVGMYGEETDFYALKAAVNGDVNAQDFVRRFLINGKADEVRALAGALPEDAAAEARRQFGAALERAAFGENTGSKAFSPERFSRFINQPGMQQKLAAFFSPEEVGQIRQIGRVGAYMNSFPAFAPVNTSNTASALANLGWLSRIPGVPQSVGLLNMAKTAAENQHAVNSALGAKLRNQPADIPAKQLELLSRILGSGMGGVAGATGTGIGN